MCIIYAPMFPRRAFATYFGLLVICLWMLILSPSDAKGQAAGSNWQRVQQLPVHTRIHVTGDRMSRVCTMDRVDDETLVCSTGRMVQTSHYTFSRSEIRRIKVTRYAVSIAAGTGIGAAVGIIALEAANGDGFFRQGELIGAGAAVGGIPGGLVGLLTDFAPGPTVYRRP